MTKEAPQTDSSALDLATWAKIVEICYSTIVRNIEQTRALKITSTSYVRRLNNNYTAVRQLLNELATPVLPSGYSPDDFEVPLDNDFSEYLTGNAHWKSTQQQLSAVLAKLDSILHDPATGKPNKLLQDQFFKFAAQLNVTLRNYRLENKVPGKTIYEITYSSAHQKIYLNGVGIYTVSADDEIKLMKAVFSQKGSEKKIAELGNSKGDGFINTKIIANNINGNSGLRKYYLGFAISSFNRTKGMKIITQITEDHIAEHGINIRAVNDWIRTK